MPLTNFPNGITSFGVPVLGGGYAPIFGDIYGVDGTYGNDGNTGSIDKPFATIQAAMNEQIAKTQGKGDAIYVNPGTYAESLVADLTGVQIIGTGRVGTRPLAKVVPVATAAYTGEFINSGFQNIEFRTPSAPTDNCAALVFETNTTTLLNMSSSYVDDCFFTAGAVDDAYESYGIIMGALAAANTTYEFCDFSRIHNNVFSSVGGRTKQLTMAICVGSPGTSEAGCEYKGITGSIISHNKINAQSIGIKLSTGATACTGTYITHNIIGSAENTGGCGLYGIRFNSAAADQLCQVMDNRVSSTGTAISNGGTAGSIMGNWVASNGTLTHQLPTIAAT
jgi:hypothetical protein